MKLDTMFKVGTVGALLTSCDNSAQGVSYGERS